MTLNINQPQYDFDAPDQHKEFRVFKQQFTSWFILWQIQEFQALPAILSCLDRKGYNIYDEWCADAATKKDWCAFLLHFESTLDTEVGPRVHVYDLEAIQKKKDKTAKELVAHIHQMAARAHIGDSSTAAIEFEVQCRFIRAITDDEIELRWRLLAAPLTATTNELLTIAESYYAVERGAQQMSSSCTKSVNAVHTGKPYRKGQSKQTQRKPQNGSDCGNCTKKHKPGHANCPAHESVCNKCGQTGHWQAKCRGGAPPCRKSDKTKPTKRHRQQGKKGRTNLVDLDEYDSQYDEIDCTQSMIILMRLRWMTW